MDDEIKKALREDHLSYDELVGLIPLVTREMRRLEQEDPKLRPMLPMTVEESLDLMFKLLAIARERPITHEEGCWFGQLLEIFRQAVRAEVLGQKGRYFCVSEADILKNSKRLEDEELGSEFIKE